MARDTLIGSLNELRGTKECFRNRNSAPRPKERDKVFLFVLVLVIRSHHLPGVTWRLPGVDCVENCKMTRLDSFSFKKSKMDLQITTGINKKCLITDGLWLCSSEELCLN